MTVQIIEATIHQLDKLAQTHGDDSVTLKPRDTHLPVNVTTHFDKPTVESRTLGKGVFVPALGLPINDPAFRNQESLKGPVEDMLRLYNYSGLRRAGRLAG